MKVSSLKDGKVVKEELDELINRHFDLSDSTSWYVCVLGKELQKLVSEKLELLEENRSLRKANLSFAPNQIKLRAENKRLEKKECMLDALEAAGVDNWEGYDEALEILREQQNES